MDEGEKEGREEVCVCVWVCDKVSDDVMNKDKGTRGTREREREREGGGERSLEALDFAIRSACDLQNVTHSKRPNHNGSSAHDRRGAQRRLRAPQPLLEALERTVAMQITMAAATPRAAAPSRGSGQPLLLWRAPLLRKSQW